MSAARIHMRAAASAASTRPSTVIARSARCCSQNSGTALDRWQLVMDSFRLPSLHQSRSTAKTLGRRSLHSSSNLRKTTLSAGPKETQAQVEVHRSSTKKPTSEWRSGKSRPLAQTTNQTPTSVDIGRKSAAASTAILHTTPATKGSPTAEPEMDYWRIYQGKLNRHETVENEELFHLGRWLRTKGRLMTKDEAKKLASVLTECRKRRLPVCFDSYNDLMFFYIKSQRYVDALKCVDYMSVAQGHRDQQSRTQALMLALYIKSSDNAAFSAAFENNLHGLKIYMAQFLKWTKGLQLKNEDIDRVKSALHDLQLKLCPPGTKRFTSLIQSRFNVDQPSDAMDLFNHTLDIGFPATDIASSAVISGLLKERLFDQAMQVWTRIANQPELKSNLAILNPLLAGLCNNPRHFEAACGLWSRILEDSTIAPDAYSFSAMMKGFFGAKAPESAVGLLDAMIGEPYKIKPDVIVYNTILTGLFNNQRPEKAREIYKRMLAANDLELSRDTYHIMLEGLLSVRDVEGVSNVITRMREKGFDLDVTTYTIITDRLFSHRDSRSALKVLNLMTELGVEPNDITYSSTIAGLARVGEVLQAQETFEQMKLKGFEPTIHTYGALIQGAFKVGNSVLAEEMAQMAKTKIKDGLSEDSYAILIGGYANLLMMDKAEYWLNEMRNWKKDAVDWKIYYIILQPCVQHRLWAQASRVVAAMQEQQFQSRVPRLNRLVDEVQRIQSGGEPRAMAGSMRPAAFAHRTWKR
ncbi:hypothetical protein EMPS_11254 [Entomortierella parvispora]|uniref:Pentacotripeptide-repeat region of PRORP domain-containing protein n=1 Tax=Entomortierella parvispora TaxID=205924 RepID=A0A9P3M2C8_9FUNG|nr:hypothetical protein EMPS_11254 [Entomortierella parvispora]